VLEGANIKLRAVVSNVVGASCRVMLDVLLRGEVDAEAMAVLARGRLRKKHAQAALGGSNGVYQRQLGSYPRHRDFLEGEVALLDAVIARRMQPWPGSTSCPASSAARGLPIRSHDPCRHAACQPQDRVQSLPEQF
jgi:hypothetical protein